MRSKTLWLFDQVPDEFLRRRVHSFYSPIGWHFGHVGRTEEFWVCQATGQSPCDENLSFIYADLPDNPKDNRVNIPDRAGTLNYLEHTRQFVLDALDRADLDSGNPLIADGYAWEFAIQHECQHQETIAEMLCLIHKSLGPQAFELLDWKSSIEPDMAAIDGGEFEMGSDDGHGYDNEKRSHAVAVEGFRLARTMVTAYQWTRFIEDGGYSRPDLWDPRGWRWRCEEDATCPEYWFRNGEGWGVFGPTGCRALHPDEPASSISWFEAQAFAMWSGMRLPSEAEREFVCSQGKFPWGESEPDTHLAQYGLEGMGPRPVGETHPGPWGLCDLAGNGWEWTSSRFLPYPGFEAFPYDGYSKDHMHGEHFVCRGGSWATAAPILRSTFRNWYVPSYRQGFLGMRLAKS